MSERTESSKTSLLKNEKKQVRQHWQIVSLWLGLYDVMAVTMSYFIGLWLRFDARYTMIPEEYLFAYVKFMPIYAFVCILVFMMLRMYRTVWRFASYSELGRVAMSSLITSLFHMGAITLFFERMPISYYIFGMFIQFGLVLGVRFSYRFMLLEKNMQKLWNI